MKPAQKIFFFLALVVFILLYFFRLNQVPEYQIQEGKMVKVRGRISRQPYLSGSQQIIYVGPILIRTERFPGFFYSQEIEVLGEFEKRVINPFQTQYLAYYPSIHLVEEKESYSQVFNFRRVLLNIRGRLEEEVNRLLPEPHSSLLLGILFGVKKQMPQEFWQKLRETGTLHIVVASGQNVSMVARFLIAVLVLVVSRRQALMMAVLGVIVYVLMVGAEAPVVRAAIMAVMAFIAQAIGREEEGSVALILAAAIMLLISPLILFDIGFQLSFAATVGILWLYPRFKEKKPFSLPLVGEGLATSIAAQLGVMPIILTNFGQMSLLSPLVNALILWTVPVAMILGAILVLLGLLIKPLALVLSWFIWLFLTYFIKMVEVFGRLPWATLKIGELSVWWATGYYLILGCLIWRKRFSERYSII